MARHEKDFCVDAQAPLSLGDLLALLDSGGGADDQTRQDAIACFLSGSDGWREAVKALSGTFAQGESKLRERKAD